jgi:hypothetical protein
MSGIDRQDQMLSGINSQFHITIKLKNSTVFA